MFSALTSRIWGFKNVIESKNCKIKILENVEAPIGMMHFTVKINVALRKQTCQKIGSKRVILHKGQ